MQNSRQWLRQLIADLQLIEVFSKNPNKDVIVHAINSGGRLLDAFVGAPKVLSRTGPKNGHQKRAVLDAVEEMVEQFTASDIVEAMKKNGFEFTAKIPVLAVNTVLRQLVRDNELVIAARGTGRRGHVYQRVSAVQT